MIYNTLHLALQGSRATLTLARPEVHNAFNPEMVCELTTAVEELGQNPAVRVVVLAAEGKSFCAGADLQSMRSVLRLSWEENVLDALELGEMLEAVRSCPKPVIARVHGSAFGGGVGLISACDLAVGVDTVQLCFSEAKLGLIPAVISPYVIARIGSSAARRYFLTAERISAAASLRLGLLSEVVSSIAELDAQIDRWSEQLAANGPEALAACKQLIEDVTGVDWDARMRRTAELIAARRVSAEGQEGMLAFLEKRPPRWTQPVGDGDVS